MDAPVSGSKGKAENAELIFLVGGEEVGSSRREANTRGNG